MFQQRGTSQKSGVGNLLSKWMPVDDVHHLFEMQYRNEKHIAFTYPTHRPRPDIAFPVSVVGQFMKTPRVLHWEAVIRTVSELPDKDCCISPIFASFKFVRC